MIITRPFPPRIGTKTQMVMGITMNWHGHEKTVDIDKLVERVDRAVSGGAVAVALTDIDNFGQLNDEQGREAGDRVLEVWIETLTGSLPKDAIVGRLGGMQLEPVIVTIGATVLSDLLSLIVFAVCVRTFTSGFSPSGLAIQISEVAVFVPLILFGLSRVGAWALNQVRDNESAHFVLALGVMVVAPVMAHLIDLPDIVGAFLAGLALNAAVRDHPTKSKLEFFGQALFIPSFFVATGFLIDPAAFAQSVLDNFPLVAGLVAALLVGKGIAAAVAGRAFGYSRAARLTMWALTLPQLAATLAAAIVAHHTVDAAGHRLLDGNMLNAVLVVMLTTSILGPMLTERFAPRLIQGE